MRPLLLGHRGVRRHAPENTIAAFRLALEHGCDGFEFDLRRTADAQCILCHDPRLAGRDVEKTPYAALLEAHRRRARNCGDDECPPLLDQVLEGFPGAFLNLELKVPGLEEAVAASVKARRLPGGYIVSSFLPEVLVRLRQLAPDMPLGLIAQTYKRLALWSTLPIDAVFVYRTLLSRESVREFHDAGKRVFAWTVNDRREMVRFAEWGVDALISDDTRLLAETFPGLKPAGNLARVSPA